jgi:WD40 repeat protein
LHGHTGAIRFLSLSEEADRCFSASADGTLRQWDIGTGRPVSSQQLGEEAFCGAATADWRTILVGHGGRLSHLRCDQALSYRAGWAVSSPVSVSEAESRAEDYRRKFEAARSLVGERDYTAALAMIEEARSIAGYERMAEILDLAGEIAATFPRQDLRDAWEELTLKGHANRVTAIALGGDGSLLISCGADQKLIAWASLCRMESWKILLSASRPIYGNSKEP